MQISGKMLLNSAENILRDRKGEAAHRPPPSGAENRKPDQGSLGGINQGVLQSRLLKLQASLRDIQHDYSREQARQAYVNQTPDKISPSLHFDGEPLFPELETDAMALTELRERITDRMRHLNRNLKGVQVEMENLYALNVSNPPGKIPGAVETLEAGALRDLDPGRVARLTRD